MSSSRAASTAFATLLCIIGPVAAGYSRTGADTLCESAAAEAAELLGVPYDVLIAISVVETGRDNRPWPWTVNIDGQGYWLDTSADAQTMVQTALDAGLTNIDLGCFQLNYRWHAEAFASISDMLDPFQNATYAAAYLAAQYDETGDWSAAAAAYHSATPEHAEHYRARFEEIWTTLAGDPEGLDDPLTETRMNRFPLLIAGQAGSSGSLVPMLAGGNRLIGEP
jgi:hypothetical protein